MRRKLFTLWSEKGSAFERRADFTRLPLTDGVFGALLSATKLPRPTDGRLRRLRAELERTGALWASHRAAPEKVPPSRVARRLRGIASDAADLAAKLDTEALVWLGDALEALAPKRGITGFERAALSVERLRDAKAEALCLSNLAQAAARQWKRGEAKARPRKERDGTRREVVAAIGRAFERAYGSSIGADMTGPGVRFLRAFFSAQGYALAPGTAKRWVSDALEHSARRSVAASIGSLRELKAQHPNAKVGELRRIADSRAARRTP